MSINIQYWCIEGKYKIYVARLIIKFAKKILFNLIIKKDNENSMDTWRRQLNQIDNEVEPNIEEQTDLLRLEQT
jgi:hypothetical protein